jgi:hypothetical protein
MDCGAGWIDFAARIADIDSKFAVRSVNFTATVSLVGNKFNCSAERVTIVVLFLRGKTHLRSMEMDGREAHSRYKQMKGGRMASPGALVLMMAESLGISPATVTQFDRVLAEGGMRSKGGRGTSAAKVTARDAANLLIAILGSPMEGAAVKNAVQTCRSYASLPVLRRASAADAFRRFGLPKIAALRKQHNLGDALETLIAGATAGQDFVIPNEDGIPLTVSDGTDFHFVITFQSPSHWASIEVAWEFVKDFPPPYPRLVYTVQNQKPRLFRGDLNQERFVSFRVIRALGALLRTVKD